MSLLKIATTADGSHTLIHEGLDETYHSIHGAIQESTHVFIQNGLHYALERFNLNEIKILEIGFGTGLNALLTLLDPEAKALPVFYDTIEAFPLKMELVHQLNYPYILGQEDIKEKFIEMHLAPWDQTYSLTGNFTIRKVQAELQRATLTNNNYDIVYFDAFAPSKQPELWRFEILEKVVKALKHQGIFVTYSAKGQLKRDLKSLGLQVEILKGPPGKLQMIRAILNP